MAGAPDEPPSEAARGDARPPDTASAFAPLRVPVFIGRNADVSVEAILLRSSELPEGFLHVPAGPYVTGGDPKNPYSSARRTGFLHGFLLARHPVTCGEYLAFLNDLAQEAPEQAARRVPRESETAGVYWPFIREGEPFDPLRSLMAGSPGEPAGGRRLERDHDVAAPPTAGKGRYVIPTEKWISEAPEHLKKQARRIPPSPLDWEEGWPVMGISWEDAMAYAAWFSRRRGVAACLPHEVMWEKGARGPDARIYPWGDYLEETFLNGLRTHEGSPRPCPCDSFPADESPYGVRGLAGNAMDWCLNDVEDGKRRILRGGSWVTYGLGNRSTARMAGAPARIGQGNGFRLAVLLAERLAETEGATPAS